MSRHDKATGLSNKGFAVLERMAADEPRFLVQVYQDRNQTRLVCGLSSMLSANEEEEALCAWLKTAGVGEVFHTGGATGDAEIWRVA